MPSHTTAPRRPASVQLRRRILAAVAITAAVASGSLGVALLTGGAAMANSGGALYIPAVPQVRTLEPLRSPGMPLTGAAVPAGWFAQPFSDADQAA